MKKFTQEEYQQVIKELFGDDYEVISDYQTSKKPVTLLHKSCGHTWTALPINIRNTQGCPKCTQIRMAKKRVIPKNEFLSRLKEKHPNIEMIGEYVDYTTPVQLRCKIDGNVWSDRPVQVIRMKYSCKVCSGIKVMPGYNSFNDLKPEFAKYLVNYEEGFKYTASSRHKLDFKCPDCGRIVGKWLNNLDDHFGCPYCSDGVSYPEKFFYSFLTQIFRESEIVKQKMIIKDDKKYLYDFFIPHLNVIFEIHGAQHYENGFKQYYEHPLEENQENDAIKKQLALDSGILEENYVVIDARKSQIDYIKNSILTSEYFKSYDLSSINWEICGKDALSSLMIKAINLFNKGKTKEEIAKQLNLSVITIRNYLKKGNELQLCNF